jgi:hypothetical protein
MSKNLIKPIILSLFFSTTLLLIFFTIFNLPNRQNYIIWHFEPAEIKIINFITDISLKNLLFEEPLWLTVNYVLRTIFSSSEIVNFYIIYNTITINIFSFILIKRVSKRSSIMVPFFLFFFYSLFILDPLFVQHIRQGFALSFLLLSFVVGKTSKPNLLILLLSPLIHYSFYFTLLPIFYYRYIYNFLGKRLNIYFNLLFISLLFLCLFLVFPFIANFLGINLYIEDGQLIDYVTPSGLGFLLLMTLTIFYILNGKFFISENILQISFLIFYLTSYYFFPSPGRLFLNSNFFAILPIFNLKNSRVFPPSSIFFSQILRSFF